MTQTNGMENWKKVSESSFLSRVVLHFYGLMIISNQTGPIFRRAWLFKSLL